MNWVHIRENEDATLDISAGWQVKRRGHSPEVQGAYWYAKVHGSAAEGFWGYLQFPEQFEAHFRGSLSQLKRLCRAAPSAAAILQDARWSFY